jgi:hypothetical protein
MSGGGGMKFRNPFNPKTKKTRPSKIRATSGSLFFMKVLLELNSGYRDQAAFTSEVD